MPRTAADAIVLRTRPVGESDLLVTLLTETSGKVSGSAKSARRSRRRFGGALEPMTRGKAVWTEVEGRELVRLESFEAQVSFAAVQADLAWFYLFAYLAEVADTFAREREPDPRFYRLVRAATDASDQGRTPGAVRRWFEIWTLRLQGLLPDLDACSRCGAKLPDEGGVVVLTGEAESLCETCAGTGARCADAARLSRDERRWLAAALRTPIARLPDPGPVSGIDRMVRLLFQAFLGRPFRTARFLEARR
jgi:DNA repair protein RecO (recombination protein O)